MPERFRGWLLRVLRVPDEPAPPPGDARFVRTFRAAPNYFRYRLAAWLLKQLSALAGLVIGYIVFRSFMLGSYMELIERIAILGFAAQLPFSFALLRLDYELRWYMLSDRSLRFREGIVSVREQTMAFANIQHIAIRQNPLQRLFGISTVVVRAAGGGGGSAASGAHGRRARSHEATFEGVDNAEQIRTVIRERIRMHLDSGLGDPDESPAVPVAALHAAEGALHGRTDASPVMATSLRPAIEAAHRLLGEATRLRAAIR
jgi:membrane protein YdbS with pleckstrin-like domain